MWETNYHGESPIADPDLKMVEPEKYDDMSAPLMNGLSLPSNELQSLYCDAAEALLEKLHS